MPETDQKTRFRIEGMDCAARAAKIDRVARHTSGGTDVNVSATAGTMVVDHEAGADLTGMAKRVAGLGYGITEASKTRSSEVRVMVGPTVNRRCTPKHRQAPDSRGYTSRKRLLCRTFSVRRVDLERSASRYCSGRMATHPPEPVACILAPKKEDLNIDTFVKSTEKGRPIGFARSRRYVFQNDRYHRTSHGNVDVAQDHRVGVIGRT